MDRRAVAAILLGLIAAVLFAAVATSGSVRYAASPPLFIERLDDVEPATEVATDAVAAEQVDERDDLEAPAWVDAVARVVLWTIVAVALALAVAKLWRDRPSLAWRRQRGDHAPFDVLDDAATAIERDAEAQRAALRHGAPRDAIVACWVRLEDAVIRAGVDRRPSDTSTELVDRVLAHRAVDPGALDELAALYREARFSSHVMPESARAAAITALDAVHAGLRRRAAVT